MDASLSDAAFVVEQWLIRVFDEGDLAAAWPITDEPLRRSLVQSWIILEADRRDVGAVDRDKLAQVLSAVNQPAHPLWTEFAAWRVIRWRNVLPRYVTRGDLRGIVSGEYATAPDIEQVWIAHVDAEVVEGVAIEAQRLLVRRLEDDWRVAGIGGVLPIPGWPPSETSRL